MSLLMINNTFVPNKVDLFEGTDNGNCLNFDVNTLGKLGDLVARSGRVRLLEVLGIDAIYLAEIVHILDQNRCFHN